MSRVLFQPGKVVFTPGAAEAFSKNRELPSTYMDRHLAGDWGKIPKEDADENEISVKNGFRIVSAYTLHDCTKIWIITESDRSCTTILLPEEY